MHVHWNAPAVILHRDAVVRMDDDINHGAMAGQCLIYGVVDGLIDQMVQPGDVRGADVHARALADRAQPFENLDVLRPVTVLLCRLHGLE